jgi:hypothetical protein
MPVPNIFGTATSAIPLSQLDTNFATPVTIGNTAVQLGNTVTSFGNVTLTNVTISSGNVSVSTATVGAGSNTAPSITTTGDTNTGIFFPAADTIAFAEGGTEAMRLDSAGNMGLGVTPSAWGGSYKGFQVAATGAFASNGSNGTVVAHNAYYDGTNDKYLTTGSASRVFQFNGGVRFDLASSGSAGSNISFTQAMTLDASGNLALGSTSILGSTNRASFTNATSAKGVLAISNTSSSGYSAVELYDNAGGQQGAVGWGNGSVAATGAQNATYLYSSGAITFLSGGTTERARLDSSGNLLVAKNSSSTATVGFEARANGVLSNTVNSITGVFINRLGNDGSLIDFQQDNNAEGSISVSGTTVSYNGGHLSRWAQTTTAKDESLVKGTVLSNLDAMNVYTDAEGNPVDNEQLNKVKVSDVEGDANVAGVFVNWTHDDAHNVDEINMAMTGDMIIRIAQGTTVQRGDLLMSAGDGTAKPQGDDIVRSKTVAKVTSTHVTCTYADGSYCVPCVLMAC